MSANNDRWSTEWFGGDSLSSADNETLGSVGNRIAFITIVRDSFEQKLFATLKAILCSSHMAGTSYMKSGTSVYQVVENKYNTFQVLFELKVARSLFNMTQKAWT